MIYPVEKLRKDGHVIAGFFYNPNIHPYSEYLKRQAEVEKYSKNASLNVNYAEYDLEQYLDYIFDNEDQHNRCPVCWWVRMKRAAQFARENGFDAFTATLLGSPYQDHEVLKNICGDIAREAGIKFYYEDFRPGFNNAHEKAKKCGMYLQNYCGCLFSEKERIEKKLSEKKHK
jgi:predicted adenine nucleotide alpha hydrolase (AANH) superfamily ATPase